MVNYQEGKIYRLVCNSTGLTYFGSTGQKYLSQRLKGHISTYKAYLKDNSRDCLTSFKIIENGNYEIILVETYPCNSKDELLKRERYHIENNECVNKIIPTRTKAQYRADNIDTIKIKDREYKQKNKEIIAIKKKEYSQRKREEQKEKDTQYQIEHIDEISEQRKIYTEKKKEKLKERHKKYYEKNKDKLVEYQRNIRLKNKQEETEKSDNEIVDELQLMGL